MNVMVLIELLDEALNNASSLPLTAKKLVDVDKCLDIISDLRINLPDDIKDAERIVADKNQFSTTRSLRPSRSSPRRERRFKAILSDHRDHQKGARRSG
jgi:hypothetical protein